MAANQLIYGTLLEAQPMAKPLYTHQINNTNIDDLYSNHIFNWLLNMAIAHTRDQSLIMDIYRLQTSCLHLSALKRENVQLD